MGGLDSSHVGVLRLTASRRRLRLANSRLRLAVKQIVVALIAIGLARHPWTGKSALPTKSKVIDDFKIVFVCKMASQNPQANSFGKKLNLLLWPVVFPTVSLKSLEAIR